MYLLNDFDRIYRDVISATVEEAYSASASPCGVAAIASPFHRIPSSYIDFAVLYICLSAFHFCKWEKFVNFAPCFSIYK